jgi:hypothetical protein
MINTVMLIYLASVIAWGIYIKKKIWTHTLDEIELSIVISFCILWIAILPLLLMYEKRRKEIIQKKRRLEELIK